MFLLEVRHCRIMKVIRACNMYRCERVLFAETRSDRADFPLLALMFIHMHSFIQTFQHSF